MKNNAGKSHKNKNRPIDHRFSKKESSNNSTFQFVGNRPEAKAQSTLQEMVNNSPQSQRIAQLQVLANNLSARALQRQEVLEGEDTLQGKFETIQKRENSIGCACPACSGVQLAASTIIQLKCSICGANSHNKNRCPKAEKSEESEDSGSSSGRGITKGNKNQRKMLGTLIGKLDRDSMYGKGAKSLVGGTKGKPSGLKNRSARIDRQGEGNVQFQIGSNSYAGVTFSQDTEPGAIVTALYKSFDNGAIMPL